MKEYPKRTGEMDKLREMLDINGIPWVDVSNWRLQIQRTHIPESGDKCKVSIICGKNSFGGSSGYLEAWDMDHDPVGWLTAEEAYEYIKEIL